METANRTVAAVILDLLAKKGVEKAFGIPGVHNLGFWNALGSGRPEIINVRHEQSCVYAADGLARASGKLSVAFTTTGPGAANTLGAFGEAAISGSKVLVISSEAPTKNRVKDGARGILHEMNNQSALFAPLAKRVNIGGQEIVFSKSTTNAEEAISTIVDYLELLDAAPGGAGYVGIPADVLNQEFASKVPLVSDAYKDYFDNLLTDDLDLSKLILALEGKKKIGIWAGGGATEIGEEIAKLSDHLHAPIFTSFAGRGIGSASENYIDLPVHEPEIEKILSECDALIVFGSQLDGMNTKNWSIQFPPVICLIDANPTITLRNINANVVIKSSNLLKVIEHLLTLSANQRWIDIPSICMQVRARLSQSENASAGMKFVAAIENSWPSSNNIVCDMAISGYWAGVYLKSSRARQISYPVGWGTLGFGLPASIGPAASGIPTLVVCGDGGIAFALGELATVAQEQLPLTILLHDDGGYGMLRFDQKVMKHPERGVNLLNPDWQVLAQSFGIEFIQTNLAELSEVLAKRSVSIAPGIVLIKDPIYPPKSTSPRWSERS